MLELGCGTGAHGPGLSGHGALTGVDRSPSMLEQARRTGCYQHLLEADVLALPRDRGYELVTSLFGVFGYLEHPAQLHAALHDAGRLLVPGGTLLVEPPIRPNDSSRRAPITSRPPSREALARTAGPGRNRASW